MHVIITIWVKLLHIKYKFVLCIYIISKVNIHLSTEKDKYTVIAKIAIINCSIYTLAAVQSV